MTDKIIQKDFTSEQPWEDFTIERIVLKDLSFERPVGPKVFLSDLQPQYSVRLQLGCDRVDKHIWEFIVTATVTAKLETHVAYLVEVQQAGVFKVAELDRERLRRLGAIDAPRLIFPYLREAVDNAVVKGGFPPIGLQPPDFEAWFAEANQPDTTAPESAAPDTTASDE